MKRILVIVKFSVTTFINPIYKYKIPQVKVFGVICIFVECKTWKKDVPLMLMVVMVLQVFDITNLISESLIGFL